MGQMHPDDAAVLARARDGDHEAFRVLVERHSRSLYRLAYRIMRNQEDAEDVVQETFVRAYRRLGRFEERSSVATWLYRITLNCAIDRVRARTRRESPEPEERLNRFAAPSAAPSADDLVYAGQIGRNLQAALGRLTRQERAAFILRHYHGCSIDEICQRLDLKSNAAKHSIFRAIQKMRLAFRPLKGRHAGRRKTVRKES